MQKLSVYALKQHRKEVLEFLQRTGAMELILGDSEEYQTMDTSQDRTKFEKIADAFDHVLEMIPKSSGDWGWKSRWLKDPSRRKL